MAYDDIKISELPDIITIDNDDSLIINDATNDLTYKVDWRDLKNSIGTISNGIIFPLGDIDQPSVAIGDYSSGIYAQDYGRFSVVTHSKSRIDINQAGTTKLFNGHLVVGNIDRACFWRMDVYNTSTFHCLTKFEGGILIPGLIIDDDGMIIEGNLIVKGDVELGSSCDDTIKLNGEVIAKCNIDLKGNIDVGGNITGKGDLIIEGNSTIGTNCDNTLDINSTTTINCDTTIKGDLTIEGDFVLDTLKGEINLGNKDAECSDVQVNINGDANVKCDLNVKGDSLLEGNLEIKGDLTADGDIILGSGGCDEGSVIIDAPTTINCDLDIDGNLHVNGNGPHEIGKPNGDIGYVPCNGQEDCPPGTLCYGGFCYPICDVMNPASCPDGTCVVVNVNGLDYEICVPDNSDIDCSNAPDINLNGNVNVACDLTVGGDTTLNGDLQVDGGLTVGRPGADCDESPVSINGDTEIECDLDVKGDTHLNNLIIDGNLIINPNGGNTDCELDSDCADGWECVGGTCVQKKCDDAHPCPAGSICVDGKCYQDCSSENCPPGFVCTQVNLDGLGNVVDICVPDPSVDCDDAPTIEINGHLDVSCDLNIGGNIYYPGGSLGEGDITLGTGCDGNVNINAQLNALCDANVDGDLRVLGNAEFGGTCAGNYVQINSRLDVDCDTVIGGNLVVDNDIEVRDGDITVNGGGFIGDGSKIFNLNIPDSMRFKGSYDVTSPPPAFAAVGDFWMNDNGDGITISAESHEGWGYTENLTNGSVPGPNGRIMVLLNQHMIYTVDGTWILGSIMDNSGYVSINTLQTITGNKIFDGGPNHYTNLYNPVTNIGTTCTDLLNVNAETKFLCGLTIGDPANPCTTGDFDVHSPTNIYCDFTVEGNISLGKACTDNIVITATTLINCPTTVANTFTVSGNHATTLGGTLTVADGKATTLGGTLQVKKATTLKSTCDITGNTSIGGNHIKLNASGNSAFAAKATSAKTVASDADNILITKSWVKDGQINFNAGNGLSESGTNATSNQSANTTKTFTVKAANDSIIVDGNGIAVDWDKNTVPGLWEEIGTNDIRPTGPGKNAVPNGACDLGTPTNAWQNVYTGDLNLSNMDHEVGNDVDGTKGMWSIQEGKDELYVINRLTGKKYKMNLTPVE